MSTVNFENLEHHQLMDSLHDFGKLSSCYDSLTYNRGDKQNSIENIDVYFFNYIFFPVLTIMFF
jgi:hypothetical protein